MKFRYVLLLASVLCGVAATQAEEITTVVTNETTQTITLGENGLGKVLRVVPQSGMSKSFKVITEGGWGMMIRFYSPNVFQVQAAPKLYTETTQTITTNMTHTGILGASADSTQVTTVTTNMVDYTVDYSDPRNDPKKAQILVGIKEDDSRVQFMDKPEAYYFKTPMLSIVLDKATGTFSVQEALYGAPIFKETAPLAFADDATTQTLNSDADTFYYGGGQQNGYFSHKGRKIAIVADGNWDEGGHPNPAPFFMSNAGYGVLRNTFSTGEYDFTSDESIKLKHNEKRFDAFYFVGGSFNQTLDLYTKFTGRPNFIPIWGLELGDADAYITRDPKTKEPVVNEDGTYKEITPDVITRVAEKYREHDMPGGWLLVNDGYGCGHMQLPYVVNTLAGLGFRTGLWTEGALDLIDWEVGTAGTRVQKLDVAWSGPAYQHGLECNRIAHDGIERNSDARGFVWTVQGWAGTQRYGVCWTGDQSGNWDLIRYHIPTLTGSGMSGQAYATTDIDGIFGGSAETYTRDLQWKCFTPAMYVMNGWSHKPKSPWAYEEPYRSINRKFLKQKLRLTPYMYTYCYEAWLTGAPIVRPMVWNYPDDQYTWDDKTQYQFMLGEDFLVAPVYTSLKVNKGWRKGGIYLPEGIWIDYNDGRRVIGPTIIEAYPITLETIPIFVRAGAIIPMYPETLYSDQVIKDTLTLDIYADASGSFTLYEDDGNTRKYQEGEYTLQTFTFENMGDSFTLQINGAEGTAYDNCCEQRAYDLKFHTQQQPKMVVVDGKEIFAITSTNAPERVYANSRECWYYDANDRYGVLHVKLGKRGIDQGVTVFAMLSDDEIAATPPYPVPEITNDLDKSLFVVTCNSQSGGNTIQNAFDGSEDTIWHSNYSKNGVTNFPYIIDIDISQLAPLTGVQYLPRSNLGNGTLKDYEIYVSRTKGVFGEPVAKGAFEAFTNATAQKIEFPITWGRYVRFKALSSQSGNQYGSAAEIDILQDITAEPLPDETTPIAKIEPAKVTGTIARDKGLKGDKLRVDNTDWTTGITVQVGSEIIYTLDGTWEKVLGHAGMEDAQGDGGNVTFRIFADDKMIFERLGMNGSQVKQLIDVEIPEGAKQLRFTLTQEPGGADSDTGVWTDLRFFRAGSKR